MTITKQDVIERLGAYEPNYQQLAASGAAAMPEIIALMQGDDVVLASKATYLASLIQSDEAAEALQVAAASPHSNVRVAVAGGLRHLPGPLAERLAARLLVDPKAGVRKLALRAAQRLGPTTLEPAVRAMASRDHVPGLRRMAEEALRSMAAAAPRDEHQPVAAVAP